MAQMFIPPPVSSLSPVRRAPWAQKRSGCPGPRARAERARHKSVPAPRMRAVVPAARPVGAESSSSMRATVRQRPVPGRHRTRVRGGRAADPGSPGPLDELIGQSGLDALAQRHPTLYFVGQFGGHVHQPVAPAHANRQIDVGAMKFSAGASTPLLATASTLALQRPQHHPLQVREAGSQPATPVAQLTRAELAQVEVWGLVWHSHTRLYALESQVKACPSPASRPRGPSSPRCRGVAARGSVRGR